MPLDASGVVVTHSGERAPGALRHGILDTRVNDRAASATATATLFPTSTKWSSKMNYEKITYWLKCGVKTSFQMFLISLFFLLFVCTGVGAYILARAVATTVLSEQFC